MAVSGDVTISQNGGQGNQKLHPYLAALVRWCISCLWGTATLFLHRLVTASLPQITAGKQPRVSLKPRRAGTEHLHPEPRVECVVLHQPPVHAHTLDVIFVHGLYGSLGNTWRQGEWRSKYKLDPTIIPLRNHPAEPCDCNRSPETDLYDLTDIYSYETTLDDQTTFKNINDKLKKILPNENNFITENFYNNTLEILDNYETQAKFVEELFKNENSKIALNDSDEGFKCNIECYNECKLNRMYQCKCKQGYSNCELECKCKTNVVNECKCKLDVNKCKTCDIGCGCVCDDCYSACWPKDWIKEDFPGARVISINYTSDPYLWRPLWVKESKRLHLHDRAEQMIDQLLALNVGRRPVVWVGHSKGGLFIKQIYCEAYEAYLQINNDKNNKQISISNENRRNINEMNNDTYEIECEKITNIQSYIRNDTKNNVEYQNNAFNKEYNKSNIPDRSFGDDGDAAWQNKIDNSVRKDGNSNLINNTPDLYDRNDNILSEAESDNLISARNENHVHEMMDDNVNKMNVYVNNDISSTKDIDDKIISSKCEEDSQGLWSRSSLWSNSVGFMFYSVPHRGSPLADFKTPITARSIELLEIAKDCPLVLDLQARWLEAAGPSKPMVRSLVETCRTLMSVLWLRIVSVDSADAGVGSLGGVSVDHREICKPSSRHCLLYNELKQLIQNSLNKCNCQ